MKEQKNLLAGQPGVIIKMVSKEGKSDDLFQLCLAAKHLDKPEADDPVDWALCRSDDDPNTMWAFEFFRDDEALKSHYGKPATDSETDQIMELLGDTPQRTFVHIRYSGLQELPGKGSLIASSQPGNVLKMVAKDGKGKELFDYTNQLHYTGDPDGPTDWMLCQEDGTENTLWAFEFYKDEPSFTRHFSDEDVDEEHDSVIDLLGGFPMREVVHTVYSSDRK